MQGVQVQWLIRITRSFTVSSQVHLMVHQEVLRCFLLSVFWLKMLQNSRKFKVFLVFLAP